MATAQTIHAVLESAEFTIAGRAGHDPDVRYLNGGKSVAKVRIAVNTGKDSEPHWFTVEAWEDLAAELADNCMKGCMVIATGRVTTNNWTSKAGEERTDLVVKAREIKVQQPQAQGTTAAKPSPQEIPF